jgi:hypothetical protein
MASNIDDNKIFMVKLLNIIEAQKIISKKLDNEYISKAKSEIVTLNKSLTLGKNLTKQISFFSKLPNY